MDSGNRCADIFRQKWKKEREKVCVMYKDIEFKESTSNAKSGKKKKDVMIDSSACSSMSLSHSEYM